MTVTLSGSAADLGLVLTLWGVGMVAGGLALPALRNISLSALTVGSLIVDGRGLPRHGRGDRRRGRGGLVARRRPRQRRPGLRVRHGPAGRDPDPSAGTGGGRDRIDPRFVAPGVGFLAGGLLAALVSPRATYLIAGAGALLVGITLATLLRARSPTARPATPQSDERIRSPTRGAFRSCKPRASPGSRHASGGADREPGVSRALKLPECRVRARRCRAIVPPSGRMG